MGFIGDFAGGILILTVAYWIFLIIEFIAMGQIGMALLLLSILLIPLSMIIHEHRKCKEKNRNN